ncbi:unnamed protein product [Fraxinus pennsylvanica]|uniref:V-type proton ATPase proteolipid subunit n=1 Tax=Fraxinus pennsylvanica TaxID=56036 RepID=A0AAD1YZ77_9LAMI|nr:unnamed protein product [Fraxinus pennsylvanica]
MSSTFSSDETTPFFGFLGAAAALVFSCMGATCGTGKSSVGVESMGVMRSELVMKSIVPVVMVGVLGIYGLIIAVIINTGINPKAKSYYCLMAMLTFLLASLVALLAFLLSQCTTAKALCWNDSYFHFAKALALYGLNFCRPFLVHQSLCG